MKRVSEKKTGAVCTNLRERTWSSKVSVCASWITFRCSCLWQCKWAMNKKNEVTKKKWVKSFTSSFFHLVCSAVWLFAVSFTWNREKISNNFNFNQSMRSWDYTTTFVVMWILHFWHWAEIITTEFGLNLREDKALCYHGILQCVVSKRLFCSFGSELRLQLLILHHHHIDSLFHPLQLVLMSGRRRDKEMWKQKSKKDFQHLRVNIPCIIWLQLPGAECTQTGCDSLVPDH